MGSTYSTWSTIWSGLVCSLVSLAAYQRPNKYRLYIFRVISIVGGNCYGDCCLCYAEQKKGNGANVVGRRRIRSIPTYLVHISQSVSQSHGALVNVFLVPFNVDWIGISVSLRGRIKFSG